MGSKRTVLIIGAGISGLSIGWRLAQAGCSVTVLERCEVKRSATWTGAGLLVLNASHQSVGKNLLLLIAQSRTLWPLFAAELEAASDMTIDFRCEGTLAVALNNHDAERLVTQYETEREHELGLKFLSGDQIREWEPQLSRSVVAALHNPNDSQVDNRKMILALRKALERANGMIRQNVSVSEIIINDGRANAVRIHNQFLTADVVVVAAGAWSERVSSFLFTDEVVMRPIKSQTLTVQTSRSKPLLHHAIYTRDVYLVPRINGQLIVGATSEDVGFDIRVTKEAAEYLLEAAYKIVPGLSSFPEIEPLVGVRPSTVDGNPILGPTNAPGLVMATGYLHNDILLAPVVAEMICRTIITDEVPQEIQPFSTNRFQRQRHPVPLR